MAHITAYRGTLDASFDVLTDNLLLSSFFQKLKKNSQPELILGFGRVFSQINGNEPKMDLIITAWDIYIQQEHVICKEKKKEPNKVFL